MQPPAWSGRGSEKMHRFFLPESSFIQDAVVITGRLTHQLRNVLRLRVGDRIIGLDNRGWQYEVELTEMGRDKVKGTIVRKAIASGEPRIKVTLYQALLKVSSFELVLQKCTEIGVTSFVPMVCERCVAGRPGNSKLGRWQDIIREAAEQSGRGRLPYLHDTMRFVEACKSARGLSLLPWEGEKLKDIGGVLGNHPRSGINGEVSIFIGPEGGFSAGEVEHAQSCGIVPVSLGHRILRAETAGLVAATIILYELGELGSVSKATQNKSSTA